MFRVRAALRLEVSALESLIQRSGIALSSGYYSTEQAAAITRHVFGVDTQLIEDGTYFVVEHKGALVACGGWSKRRTLFGGDQTKTGVDPLLNPIEEPARIRAFFVEPDWARQGLGRLLMEHCTHEAQQAGFRRLELVSTLPGEPLYLASGFKVLERFELNLPDGIRVPVSRMARSIA